MMKLKSGFVLRQVGAHYFVVPVGAQTVDFNGMITLNETGAFLWRQLQEGASAEMLTEALLAEYDVTPATATADVLAFIDKIHNAELFA